MSQYSGKAKILYFIESFIRIDTYIKAMEQVHFG